MGGGDDGIKHFMEYLMDPMAAMFQALGNPEITPDLKRTIAEGVRQEAGNHKVDQLAQAENEALAGLLRLCAKADGTPP